MRRILVLLGVALAGPLALAPNAPAIIPPAPVVAAGTVFAPAAMVVPIGVSLTWIYTPPLAHTITTADTAVDALLNHPNDPNDTNCRVDGEPGEDNNPDTCHVNFVGGEFSHVFAQGGQYIYYCTFHNIMGMVGVVEVV